MSSGKAPAFVSPASRGAQAQQKSPVAVAVVAAPSATSAWCWPDSESLAGQWRGLGGPAFHVMHWWSVAKRRKLAPPFYK